MTNGVKMAENTNFVVFVSLIGAEWLISLIVIKYGNNIAIDPTGIVVLGNFFDYGSTSCCYLKCICYIVICRLWFCLRMYVYAFERIGVRNVVDYSFLLQYACVKIRITYCE